MSGLIQATSRGVKGTLADGTVRIMIEVDPIHANDAFALFGMPGSPVVIARLTQEAATAAQQAEVVADAEADEKPKGGPLARLAGQLCNNPMFQRYTRTANAEDAAHRVRQWCNVESRAELDHCEGAAAEFEKVRQRYVAWRDAQGVTA